MLKSILLLFCLAGATFATDISGAWDFAVETSAGSGNPSFVFKQDGEKLTGTYSGLLGKAELTGTVKGDQVDFQFKVSNENATGTVHYKGTIESATKMKGEVELAELGKGTWTASKK